MSKKLILSSVIIAAFAFTTVGCGKKPATAPNETTVVVAPAAEENKPAPAAADENKPADATAAPAPAAAAPAPAPAEPAPAAPASDAGTAR